MVTLSALWLPIVVSAVLVFLASWVLHMLLPLHRKDYKQLPEEEAILEALRRHKPPPGNYMFPHCASPKEMGSPEMKEKWDRGPVGIMNLMPDGPPAMGKYLAQWFVYCLLVSIFVAYLAGRTLDAGTAYLAVFRVAGTAAFLVYGLSQLVDSIWKAQLWPTTMKHVFDGVVYALLTAGAFGWLWPA